jgi:hypothetical protein
VAAEHDRARSRRLVAVERGGARECVEDRHRHPGELGADARRAVGGPDAAHDVRRRVGPGEVAVRLGHAGPQAAGSACHVDRIRHEPGPRSLLDHLADQVDGDVGDRPGVEGALAWGLRGEREAAARPHGTGVHVGDCGQRRDTPLRRGLGDGPVERRRSAVADGTGMHDHGRTGLPHVVGHAFPQEGADDQFRIEGVDGGAHRVVVHRLPPRDLMSSAAELHPHPLGESVEGGAEQEDLHVRLRCRKTTRAAAQNCNAAHAVGHALSRW